MRRLRHDHVADRDDEGGYVLPLVALALTVLMIAAAFAVDVGAWYSRGNQLQRAADAAALAGVVWMPDFTKAETVALEAAAKNGIVNGGNITVTVAPIAGVKNQLRVTVTDTKAEQYFSNVVMARPTITRAALAEYVLPVPLGSPRNFFGTGTLASGFNENLWLSVNSWCTDKVDGDRYQSRYFGNRPYSSENCQNPPPAVSGLLNSEYRPGGYEFYVDLPAGRPYSTDVLLFDPRYETGAGGPDLSLYTGAQSYTFGLFSADATPLDDSDNPPVSGCSQTFTSSAPAFNYGPYLGSSRWFRLCTLANSAPSGRYILRVKNNAGERFGAGANNYSIVARPSTFAGTGLCDRRTVATCPGVYGKDTISVFANQSSSTADFFLAEIDPVHVGKKLRITLFDPGEGGNDIRIRRPIGTNSWTDASFTWTADDGTSGSGTSLDVTGSRFNGKVVVLEVNLAGYAPPADNHWWQIRYNFGTGTVTDRTTWSVLIVGDPVHLVNEN